MATRYLFAACLLVLSCASAANPQEASAPAAFQPRTVVALPDDSKVQVRWVVPPPLTPSEVAPGYDSLSFSVDHEGQPWIMRFGSILFNPVRQHIFRPTRTCTGVACLDIGATLLATDSELGFVVLGERPDHSTPDLPTAYFQPLVQLPLPGCRLYAGYGDCLYLAGRNEASGQTEVFLLRPENGRLRTFRRIFTCTEDVTSVTGDGSVTFVALGSVIVRIRDTAAEPEKFHTVPGSTVYGMAYSPRAGLFYCVEDGVGFAGQAGSLLFCATPGPQISLRGDSLYILFPQSQGVLALDNISDFRRWRLDMAPVAATASAGARLKLVRLFEGGDVPSEPAGRVYGNVFDWRQARNVYCEVDLENLRKSGPEHAHRVRFGLEMPGAPADLSCYTELICTLGPEDASLLECARFSVQGGQISVPGTYVLTIWLDGVKADQQTFTLKGQPDLVEAVILQDTPFVESLLKAGVDPNGNGQGSPPLVHAALAGNVPIANLLLEAGADPDLAGSAGLSPLPAALYREHADIVQILAGSGADPNLKDDDGRSMLHVAAGKASAEAVKALLQAGGDPNGADNAGFTPLSAAVRARDPECVRLLLDAGAEADWWIDEFGDGRETSLLAMAMWDYEFYPGGDSRRRVRQIIDLLKARGAYCSGEEGTGFLWMGRDALLGRENVAYILETSPDAAQYYEPEDSYLRRVVLRRLLGLSASAIKSAVDAGGFRKALELCVRARDLAGKWQMLGQLPEISYNCGIIANQLGLNTEARTWLEEFVTLAPDSPDAAAARTILQGLPGASGIQSGV